MGFRDEAGAQQLALRGGIDRIGLDLGVGDGLEELRMGQVEVNPLGHQQVAEPIPPAGSFDDGLVRPRELGEVPAHGRGIVGQRGLANPVAGSGERSQR